MTDRYLITHLYSVKGRSIYNEVLNTVRPLKPIRMGKKIKTKQKSVTHICLLSVYTERGKYVEIIKR